MASTGTRPQDPFIESKFKVEIDGVDAGHFQSITGGSMSIVVVESTKLFENGATQGIYIPTQTSFEPITLTQGITDNMEFWNWWIKIADGYVERRSVSISAVGYLDGTSNELKEARWDMTEAWPSRISGFNFNAESKQITIASVTLVVESVTRVA